VLCFVRHTVETVYTLPAPSSVHFLRLAGLAELAASPLRLPEAGGVAGLLPPLLLPPIEFRFLPVAGAAALPAGAGAC